MVGIWWDFVEVVLVLVLGFLFDPDFAGVGFFLFFFIVFVRLFALAFDGLAFHEEVVDAHSSWVWFVVDEFDVYELDGLVADDGLVDVFFLKVKVELQLGH